MNEEQGRGSIEAVLEANARRDRWREAASWVREKEGVALKELIHKDFPLPLFEKRHVSCFGRDLRGNVVQPECPELIRREDGRTTCGGCCPQNKEPDNEVKEGALLSPLLYPKLVCPLNREGFANPPSTSFDEQASRIELNGFTWGVGDLIAFMWIAQGYRAQGRKVVFYHLRDSYRELAEACGFEVVKSVSRPKQMVGWGDQKWNDFYRWDLYTYKGEMPRVEVWAKHLPIPTTAMRPRVGRIPEEVRGRVGDFLKGTIPRGSKGRILIAPMSYYPTREWPLAYWGDLYQYLSEAGYAVTAVVGKDQRNRVPHTLSSIYSPESFLDTLALMEEMDFFVGGDSGPAWLADLGGLPGVMLCGPSRGVMPRDSKVEEVWMDPEKVPCVRCSFNEEKGHREVCRLACRALLQLDPEVVAERVLKALDPSFKGRVRPGERWVGQGYISLQIKRASPILGVNHGD